MIIVCWTCSDRGLHGGPQGFGHLSAEAHEDLGVYSTTSYWRTLVGCIHSYLTQCKAWVHRACAAVLSVPGAGTQQQGTLPVLGNGWQECQCPTTNPAGGLGVLRQERKKVGVWVP